MLVNEAATVVMVVGEPPSWGEVGSGGSDAVGRVNGGGEVVTEAVVKETASGRRRLLDDRGGRKLWCWGTARKYSLSGAEFWST